MFRHRKSGVANDGCGSAGRACNVCVPGQSCILNACVLAGGGGGTANVCGCTGQTDGDFCAARSRSCGPASGNDNCGVYRSVNCGGCASPNVCSDGTCTYPGEADYQMCSRLSAACGALTGLDLCGQTRTIASCGTCGAGTSCGAGGTTANTCLPVQPLPAGICTVNGWCWKAPGPLNERLTSVSIDASGSGGWAVGTNGTVLRWDGASLRGWWLLREVTFNAVWSNGPSDVWVWGSSDADLYLEVEVTATGATDLVLHWNGTAWTREQFPTGFFALNRVVMVGGQRWAYRGWNMNSSYDTTFGILK
ncbi:MAG: hypothetical protein ACYC8T_05790 [Myxococcaceae bacterium]